MSNLESFILLAVLQTNKDIVGITQIAQTTYTIVLNITNNFNQKIVSFTSIIVYLSSVQYVKPTISG